MKKTICTFAVLCLAVGIQTACAEDGRTPPRGGFAENLFERMDANGDGVVTRQEFEAFTKKQFDEMDANHDGKITREELDAAREKHGALMREQFNKRFDEADANHDGALSKEEAQKLPHIAQHFDEIDANHDGKVTRDEIGAYMMKQQRGQGR